MGWTSFPISYYNNFINNKGEFNRKAFLDHEMTSDEEKYSWKVLKSYMYGSVWYGAIQRIKKEDNSSIIYAEVVLTSVENGEFYYKEMEESMGPYSYKCPNSILDMLSPTDNTYANDWRKRCREENDKALLCKKFWKEAQDKEKVDYIEYVSKYDFKDYAVGDTIYLHYGTYMVRGKLTKCWSDGLYRFRKKDIDPELCTLVYKDGTKIQVHLV